MKRATLFLALCCAALSASAQLNNPGFESWYTDASGVTQLVGWRHENRTGSISNQLIGTQQSTNSQQGLYALRLSRWYNYTWDQARQNTSLGIRPQALTGFYLYTDNQLTAPTLLDTALVQVFLTKWNSATQQPDTIGYGTQELGAVMAYTFFSCPISYTGSQTPDSLSVLISPTKWYAGGSGWCSDSSYCSFLTIDQLALSTTTAVLASEKHEVTGLYPNPASTYIGLRLEQPLTGRPGRLEIFDAQGRLVRQQELQPSSSPELRVPLQRLPAGVYTLKLLTGERVLVNRLVVE